jgi:tRNA (cmo5U34)-methyltransferase
MPKDNVFLGANSQAPFEFNQAVVDVFPDMLARSVPFYKEVLAQMAAIAAPVMAEMPTQTVYDLGCSQGAWVPFLTSVTPALNYIGYDQSEGMIHRAQTWATDAIQFFVRDITTVSVFDNASIIACHLVLQFIDPARRPALIELMYQALPDNGIFLLVEKIHHQNPWVQDCYRNEYHAFKQRNGYSMAEVINKEVALNGVLMTQTQQDYEDQLNAAGFQTVDVFFKWFNFMGIMAKK